ncbi:MAG: thioredoxin TrxC [Epsilonproteobacteria bacterium]|nr:thioredoxin TrxC [Campylobacterota bacterium]
MEKIRVICPHCLKPNNVVKKDEYKKAVCGHCKGNLLDNAPINADDSNFEYILSNTDLPVFVDFWAQWCGPCKMFAPTFNEVSRSLPLKAQFVKVNTEQAQMTAAKNRIRSIPTIVAFHKNVEIHRVSGMMPTPQFMQWATQIIQQCN